MRSNAIAAAALSLGAFWAGTTAAHHAFSAEFGSEMGVIEGEVVEVLYENPHSHFMLKVINENGEEEIWDGHGQNLRVMMRSGWQRSTVEVGDTLRIEGNLGLAGAKKIAIVNAQQEDGTILSPFPGFRGFVSAFAESQAEAARQQEEQ